MLNVNPDHVWREIPSKPGRWYLDTLNDEDRARRDRCRRFLEEKAVERMKRVLEREAA